MGQRAVVNMLKEDEPQTHHLIFITHPDDPFALEGTFQLPTLAKEFLLLGFHDISFESPDHRGPTKDDVMSALKFAEDKEDLVICCHAGISRSSATAYTITTQRTNPQDALSVLTLGRHFPNQLIVKHGSVILQKPEMMELIEDFHRRSHEQNEKEALDSTDLSNFQ